MKLQQDCAIESVSTKITAINDIMLCIKSLSYQCLLLGLFNPRKPTVPCMGHQL